MKSLTPHGSKSEHERPKAHRPFQVNENLETVINAQGNLRVTSLKVVLAPLIES